MLITRRYRSNSLKLHLSAFCGALLWAAAGLGTAVHAEDGVDLVSESALDLRPEDASDACRADIPQIRVTVNGVYAEGLLTVEAYDDNSKAFLSREGRLRRTRNAAQDGSQTVCMNVTGAGTYAVALYHDIDGNRKLARKWNFLPKEPFGLSNNPKLKLRKPRHREAAFEAGPLGADVTVNLRGAKPDA